MCRSASVRRAAFLAIRSSRVGKHPLQHGRSSRALVGAARRSRLVPGYSARLRFIYTSRAVLTGQADGEMREQASRCHVASRSYTGDMRKDSLFRVRMPSSEVAALERVAKERGQAASGYARTLIVEQVARDEAARHVREALRGGRQSRLTDDQALALADEAKHASRER